MIDENYFWISSVDPHPSPVGHEQLASYMLPTVEPFVTSICEDV
ncbi:MAG: hypothetical protein AAFV33_24160 [Chloroflexota bacterium]